MNTYQKALENHKNFVIWGCGGYFNEIINRLDPNINIIYVCDRDEKRWGNVDTVRELQCVSPEVLGNINDIFVLIAIKNRCIVREVQRELEEMGLPHCHVNKAVEAYREEYESKQIAKYDKTIGQLSEPQDKKLLKCFISVSVPVQACQLKCRYCYIGQHGGFEDDEIMIPTAGFIRKALSRKRLGGTALINFCGVGETLLYKELHPIIRELADEGHYISIITNALLIKEINRYLQFPDEWRKKLFFKCSLHYRQLKEKNMLELFAENVKRIWKSGISVSVELVPEDELVPLIPEIKKYSMEHFGALPHVTVARDESKNDMPIISEYGEEEYRKIWGMFDSAMFSFKMNQMVKRKEHCTAGRNTFLFSLESGSILPCPQEKPFYNIYKDISQKIPYKEVGRLCSGPYCHNGHAYLALGIVSEVKECSYLQIRDRTMSCGAHWVNKEMAAIFMQRICDNDI